MRGLAWVAHYGLSYDLVVAKNIRKSVLVEVFFFSIKNAFLVNHVFYMYDLSTYVCWRLNRNNIILRTHNYRY